MGNPQRKSLQKGEGAEPSPAPCLSDMHLTFMALGPSPQPCVDPCEHFFVHTSPSIMHFLMPCMKSGFGGLWCGCILSPPNPDVYSPEYSLAVSTVLLDQGRPKVCQECRSRSLFQSGEGDPGITQIFHLACRPCQSFPAELPLSVILDGSNGPTLPFLPVSSTSRSMISWASQFSTSSHLWQVSQSQ